MNTINTANSSLVDGVNRCPACGSTDIQLRPSSGKLACLFCRHEWAEAQIEQVVGAIAIDQLVGTHVASGAANIDPSVAGVVTFKCGGCGSEVVVNLEEAFAARCHWCRHMLTVNEQVPNGAVPDAVLPFSLSRDAAIEKITAFAGKRKLFAHKEFKGNFNPEHVVGVYLPYLIVDSNVTANLYGYGEVTIRTYSGGDNSSDTYDVDTYQVSRTISFLVDDLILESSAERANFDSPVNTNNIINAVLPFDTKEAVRWNAHYLTGFTSEKRDQDIAAVEPMLDDQLLSIARSQAAPSVKQYGRGVRWEAEQLERHGTRWVSMYLPVWLYSYYHQSGGKAMVHYIAVNARTGKAMGSVPVSHHRIGAMAALVGVVAEILAIIGLVVGS